MTYKAVPLRAWVTAGVMLGVVALLTVALHVPGRLTAAGTRTFTTSPSMGPPGTSVTLNGSKWTQSNNPYRIFWETIGGTNLGDFTLNGSGSFSKKVVIPSATVGGHQIVACEGFSTEFQVCVSKPFTVTAAPTPTPGGPTATPTPVNMPPTVTILSPAASASITTQTVEVHIHVTEDNDLDTVTADVIRVSGGEQVGAYEFCGTPSSLDHFCPSSPPSPIVYDRLSLGGIFLSDPDGLTPGAYQIRVTACDGKAQCTTTTRNFTLNLPTPTPVPPGVSGFKIEINQGVQSNLCDAPPLHGFNNCQTLSSVIPPPIPSGKDTYVRVYLLADGGPRPNYSGRLLVHAFHAGGSVTSRLINPNVVASAGSSDALLAQVPQDPGDDAARRRLALEMRADPATTLNFVIPGSFLQDAETVQVELDGVTGLVELDMAPLRLGINVVRSSGSPDEATIESAILPYLRKAYPVSEVRVLSVRQTDILLSCVFWDPCDPDDPSCDLMDAIWSLYGGGDSPARFSTSDPHYTMTVYVVPGLRGCAPIGDPDDNDYRYGGVAVIDVSGEDAAHEIGHAIGLRHASCAHGATGCETWPWPHGELGHATEDPPASYDDFGAIPMPASDPNYWTVWMVDPCPAPDFADRRPMCTVDKGATVDNLTHDFMSYGGGAVPASFPVSAQHDQWVSARTYNHIYRNICCRGAVQQPIAGFPDATPEPRIEALLIRGVVHPDGSASLRPVLRRPVLQSFAQGGAPGSYELQLLGAGGQVLYQRSFEPALNDDSTGTLIEEIVPYVAGLGRILLRHNGKIIIDRTGSASAPQVHVTSPNGGETFATGTQTISWTASDADGDPLGFTVQYSPDGGQTWEAIALLPPGQPNEAQLDVDVLTNGTHGLVRVTASDGFNTASDMSDCPFALGPGTPAPCAPVGDANCDGTVNAIDAALVLQFSAGLVSSLACPDAADANADGSVNAIDAALILQFSAGLLSTLPPAVASLPGQ